MVGIATMVVRNVQLACGPALDAGVTYRLDHRTWRSLPVVLLVSVWRQHDQVVKAVHNFAPRLVDDDHDGDTHVRRLY